MAKIKICIEAGCQNVSTTEHYCRLHYLKNWKLLREEKKKKAAERLNKYVDGICKKFPDRYVDEVKKDIHSGGFALDGGNEPGADSFDFAESYGESSVFRDDESLERLISKIKIDKGF